MDEQDNNNLRPDDVVEQFAASLMQKNRIHRIPGKFYIIYQFLYILIYIYLFKIT